MPGRDEQQWLQLDVHQVTEILHTHLLVHAGVLHPHQVRQVLRGGSDTARSAPTRSAAVDQLATSNIMIVAEWASTALLISILIAAALATLLCTDQSRGPACAAPGRRVHLQPVPERRKVYQFYQHGLQHAQVQK